MKSYYITFRSVTFAQRGERLLKEASVRCSLRRTPRWMEEQGCGYALRLWTRDIAEAVALLRRENIPLRRVYGVLGEGELEVLEL